MLRSGKAKQQKLVNAINKFDRIGSSFPNKHEVYVSNTEKFNCNLVREFPLVSCDMFFICIAKFLI